MPDTELLVVLPVYNEQESIIHVLNQWIPELERVVKNYRILAIDDGSTDSTLAILKNLQSSASGKLEIFSRSNLGHGQTCIQGYKIAIDRSIPYILQIDSDGQSNPKFLADFWGRRTDYDVIYGVRRRFDGPARVLASKTMRILLRVLEGVNCVDANVPYRIMDSRSCAESIRLIPEGISLANVALAVVLKRDPQIRHGAVPIDFPPRFGGEPSVALSSFAWKAIELFTQLRQLRSRSAS